MPVGRRAAVLHSTSAYSLAPPLRRHQPFVAVARRSGRRFSDALLDERVPRAAVGAASEPFRRLGAALLADEHVPWTSQPNDYGSFRARVGPVARVGQVGQVAQVARVGQVARVAQVRGRCVRPYAMPAPSMNPSNPLTIVRVTGRRLPSSQRRRRTDRGPRRIRQTRPAIESRLVGHHRPPGRPEDGAGRRPATTPVIAATRHRAPPRGAAMPPCARRRVASA